MIDRLRRWRASLFGPAAEAPYRRRTSDWIRVAVAIVLLLAAARHAGEATATERAIFNVFNTLPGSLLPVFRTIYRVGALWAVGLVVVAAIVGRRWRLARDLLLAGLLAWLFGRFLSEVVVGGATQGLHAVARLGATPSFPAVRLAVLVAIVRVASPYVTRPTKRVSRLLVAGFAIAGLYLGTASPNDVFAGLVLGWAIAATVHLLFGSPGGRPTTEQVRRSLAELGIDARDVRLAAHQPTGSTLMWALDDDGPLRIKVIGRDEADAQFMAKLWRFFVYKDSGPRLSLTRVQQVEHEAYLMLVARDQGVRVPRVVAAGTAGPRAALLVHRSMEGTLLSQQDPDALDDAALCAVWEQVRALHAAGVVHGQLDGDHVVMGADGPAIVAFTAGTMSADADDVAGDVAQLLAATAAVVGAERAVRAAMTTDADAVAPALSLLQPAVVTRPTLRELGANARDARRRLGELRREGAAALGIEAPEPVQLQRVRPANVALAVGTLVAVAALLSEIGNPEDVASTLRHADWGWLAVAAALSLAANVGYAIGLQGTVHRRLPLWPTTELQLAMSFSNLAVPGVGGMGMQVRFLQQQGVDLASAVAAGGLISSIGNLAAAFGLFALAVIVEPAHVDLSLLPTDALAEGTALLAVGFLVVAAVVLGIPLLRRRVVPPVRRGMAAVAVAFRSPRQLSLLLGGNVLAALLSTWCLVACLHAYGGSASFWALLAANLGVVTVASIVPVPGGGTAVGTVGLSAALVAFGVPREVAVATVLTNQLIFYYLPAVPGWFATRHLARHGYL